MIQDKQYPKLVTNKIRKLCQYFIEDKQDNSLRVYLTKGAIGSFIIKITSTAFTLLISVMLARILGAEGYGYYAYAMAIVNLLIVPTQLGLPNLLVRQTAIYKTREQWGLMRGLFLRSNQAVILISLILIITTFFATWVFSDYIPSLSFPVFCIALAMLPFLGLGSLQGASLRGLNHVLLGQVPMNVVKQLIFILLLLLFVLLSSTSKLDSRLAMELQAIAVFAAFVFSLILLFNYLPKQIRKVNTQYDTPRWVKSGLFFLLASGMHVINNRIDMIMLGVFANSKIVGVYQVVTRGAELIIFSLFAVNMAIAPIISRLYVNSDMKKLQRVVGVSSGAMLIFSLPIAVLLIFFGPWILSNIFGLEFIMGATALAILSVGQLINAMVGSVGYLLNMTGYEKYNAKVLSISAIINISLNLILIPRWGIEGAALATTTTLLIWNILLAIHVYKKLHIYPGILGCICRSKY